MPRNPAGSQDPHDPQVEGQPLEGEQVADEELPATGGEQPSVQEGFLESDEDPPIAEEPPTVDEGPPSAEDEPPLEEATPVIAVFAPAAGQPPEPPQQAPPSAPGSGPGSTPVSARGIVVLVTLYFGISVICIYSMLTFWPTQAGLTARTTTTPATATTTESEGGPEAQPPSGDGEGTQPPAGGQAQEPQPVEPPPKNVSFFGLGPWKVDIEILFFLIVACAGALGGSVAAIRSLGIYVGSRTLTRSWIPFYLFKPLLGALLATVVYLLLRAGLFSPSASNAQVSPYGFAAIGALVGLFSEQAAEKLRRVANELFNPPYEQPPPDHYAEPTKQEEQQP